MPDDQQAFCTKAGTETIPRWRFHANRYGVSLAFKSSRSPHINLYVIFRTHEVDWGIKRWGCRVARHSWAPGSRHLHIGVGKRWCFDIHMFPKKAKLQGAV